MPTASKQARANLITNVDKAICGFEPLMCEVMTVKYDLNKIQDTIGCSDKALELLSAYLDVIYGVQCVQYDLSVALKRLFQSDIPYVKRFYIQYLNMCFCEGCDLFVDNTNNGNGLLNRLGSALTALNISGYSSELSYIIRRITEFKTEHTDKTLRNIFRHYGCPVAMYEVQLQLNDEDPFARKASSLYGILSHISALCMQISELFKKGECTEPSCKGSHINVTQLLNSAIYDAFRGKDAYKTISGTISRVTEAVDSSYRYYLLTNKLRGYCGDKADELNNIEEAQCILKFQMTTEFLQLDLASAVQGYLLSDTNIERSHSLAFMRVTRQAALTHLFGYNDKARRNSIWADIEDIAGHLGLNDRMAKLHQSFTELTTNLKIDSEASNLFSHYRYNQKNTLYKRFESISNSNDIIELQESIKLLHLCSEIYAFTQELLNGLKTHIDRRNKDSMDSFLSEFYNLESLIKSSDITPEVKAKMTDALQSVQSTILHCVNHLS